jgi:copper chaperone CopZ
MARRIKGVEEVYVDRGSGQIILDYDGADGTVEKIQQFVVAIGYQANLISREPVVTATEV